MTLEEQKSILSIALFAAFADGKKEDREREQIRRISESLAEESAMADLSRLYQDVLLKRSTLETVTAALTDPGQRQLAYEMAIGVCDADGRQSETERHFLARLKDLLQLDREQADIIDGQADAIVDLSEAGAPLTAIGSAPAIPGQVIASVARVTETELDKSILNFALFNGALELLPQSWASMAIIPLQIKMVYNIGKTHSVELDQGHIKEFIAAAGVGLTSQYVEQIGRKLIGGLIGKMAGKGFGKIGSAATGMAFSFATTYALGQLAKRYYAGGRVMSSSLLRETFQNLLGPAKQLQAQYLPQIRQQANTIDMGQVMAMVRGN